MEVYNIFGEFNSNVVYTTFILLYLVFLGINYFIF